MRGRWRRGPEPPIQGQTPPPPFQFLFPPTPPCQGTAEAGKPLFRPTLHLQGGQGMRQPPLHGPPASELSRGSPARAGPFLHSAPPPPSHLRSPGPPSRLTPFPSFSPGPGIWGGARATSPASGAAWCPLPVRVLRRGPTDPSTWTGRGGCSHGYGRPPRAAPPPPVVKGVRVQSGWQVDQVAREDSWVQMCLLSGDMCYLDM